MTFKKTFLSLLALITMGGSAMADDKPVITVADVEALPGETVSFYVNLKDGKDNTYKGMVLYAYSTQAGFTLTDVTAATEWGATGAVGVINPAVGNPSVSVNSAKALPSGTIDNLLTVSLAVDNSVALGEYDITLEKTALRYFDAQDNPCEDIADDVTFTVKVVNAHSVVLDENSTTAPVAATGVNVTVNRTINANEWSTICLPFAMSEAQVKAAFGNDVQLGDFTGYTPTYDGSENVTAITVNFNDVTAIEANHPYIIKVSSAITEFTADGVTIDPQEAIVSFGTTTGSGKNKVYHPSDFIGTYVADFNFYNDATSYPLFLSGNKFYYATENTKHMKAFRAYFDFDDYMPEADITSAPIFISFNNDVTGIQNIQRTAEDGKCYNLNGQRVVSPKKGLYIKNGKKVVVK